MVADNAILHRQISNLARTDASRMLNHRAFVDKLSEMRY